MFTEYSLWFLPLIIVISFGISYFVYFFRDKANATFNKNQKYLLFTLRFLGIFFILFLLISPIKRIKNKIIEKPTIVLLQDNSSSISATKFSKYYKTKYINDLQKLSDKLAKNYNIVRILFGNNPNQLKDEIKWRDTLKFNGFTTDISESLNFVLENFSLENLSAVVLATDGINTQGNNFLNLTDNFSCPLYTIAMGDTTTRKDIFISDIQYNKIAFIDNDYPIEVTVKANKALNEKSSLFMIKDGKTTKLKTLLIDNNDYSITSELKTHSKKAGIEKISFYIEQIDGESNKTNNKKDIFIEVLNAKKNILILANAPHPDISAIKTALQTNQNYSIDVNILSTSNNTITKSLKNITDYDLIILHSLPNNSNSYNIIKNLKEKQSSLLFILGQSTNIQLFNALNTGISINTSSNYTNNVLASYNPSFSLFTVSEDITNILKDMPPMLSIAAKYNLKTNIQILLFQKIGTISTTYPLIAFNNEDVSKIGFIFGENIWKWRMQNYLLHNSTEMIDEIIKKATQLLSTKSNKNRFRVEHKDVYQQNENIVFTAQFYNENFELINTPEVKINIKHLTNNTEYTFGKNNNAYYLNLGSFEQGEYSFTAKTTYNNKEYKQNSIFAISSNNAELNSLVAKHSALYTLSAKTDAKMIYPQNIKDLENLIKQNNNIKPIIHVNTENRKFISLWWYWLLIILTLGSEWFLRKYWGRI